MSGLRERLHHVTSEESHDLEHSHSRLDSASIKALIPLRRHVPFIASPLDPKTTKWLEQKTSASNMTLKRRPTVAQQEAHNVSGGIFRKQSEASPLELFFDLFFVANLAVFGFNFSQATPSGTYKPTFRTTDFLLTVISSGQLYRILLTDVVILVQYCPARCPVLCRYRPQPLPQVVSVRHLDCFHRPWPHLYRHIRKLRNASISRYCSSLHGISIDLYASVRGGVLVCTSIQEDLDTLCLDDASISMLGNGVFRYLSCWPRPCTYWSGRSSSCEYLVCCHRPRSCH